MSGIKNNRTIITHKALLAGVLAAFAAVGVTIGFATQRDTDSGGAVNGTNGDIRYIEVVGEDYGPDGSTSSVWEMRVWLSKDGSSMRREGSSGTVEQTVVIQGDTVKELRTRSETVSYTELRVLPQYEADVKENRRPEFLKAPERLAAGELTEVARETKDGRTLITARMERPLDEADREGESEGPPITGYEVVFDDHSGLTLEQRFYTTGPDGSDQLLGGTRYEYPSDSLVADEGVFTLEPPVGAWQYKDVQLAPGEVGSFAAFTLYSVGSEFRGAPLTVVQESERQNTPSPSHHVNFVYEGASLTVTNHAAAALAGVARCEGGEAVVPGSIGDVVLEGNRACGYGEEITTDLGPAVLRSDSPTVEIQLGNTVVFVHADSPESAVEAANKLAAAN